MRKGEPGPRARAGNGGTACRSLKGWGRMFRAQELWWGVCEEAVVGGDRLTAGDGRRPSVYLSTEDVGGLQKGAGLCNFNR